MAACAKQVREKQEAKAAQQAAAKAAEEREEAQIQAYYRRQQAQEQQQLHYAASRSSRASAHSSPLAPPTLDPYSHATHSQQAPGYHDYDPHNSTSSQNVHSSARQGHWHKEEQHGHVAALSSYPTASAHPHQGNGLSDEWAGHSAAASPESGQRPMHQGPHGFRAPQNLPGIGGGPRSSQHGPQHPEGSHAWRQQQAASTDRHVPGLDVGREPQHTSTERMHDHHRPESWGGHNHSRWGGQQANGGRRGPSSNATQPGMALLHQACSSVCLYAPSDGTWFIYQKYSRVSHPHFSRKTAAQTSHIRPYPLS